MEENGYDGFIVYESCGRLDYDKDTYPYLSTYDVDKAREEQNWVASEDIMRTHVVSMFRYMAKQTSFNEMMGRENSTVYTSIADNIERHGLNIYGFTVITQKSDLLRISETEGVAYIYTKPIR